MTPAAIIFGSIGTLVETSEIQRDAFNEAFREAGLDWEWDRASYQEMLRAAGGRDRIGVYAKERGETVDAAALHARKTEIFDDRMRAEGLALRDGVSDVLDWGARTGTPVAFASTTSRANIDAMMDAVDGLRDRLAFVADASMVERVKPDPEVYALACEKLGVLPEDCIGIEDTEVNLAAPRAAGLVAVAFPGANSGGQDFSAAALVTDRLDPAAFADL